MKKKILKFERVADICAEMRREGKRIIHCHGRFNLLHIGHIRQFQQARSMGDKVIVTVISDDQADHGTDRPAFSEDLRAEALASLDSVDYVAISYEKDLAAVLKKLSPDAYFKVSGYPDPGEEIAAGAEREERICEALGIEFHLAQDLSFNSTSLINKFFSSFSEETQEYLSLFRQRYSVDDVFGVIDRMSELSVAVIGDTIIDEYHYCSVLGASSKDPVLAVKYNSQDAFPGGVLAVSNHVANFAKNVSLYSVVGDDKGYLDLIHRAMRDNIAAKFVIKENSPTLVKRRFIEGYTLNKLFEVYIMDSTGLEEVQDEGFRQRLETELPKHDLVIVADYGHGAISAETRRTIIDRSSCLAVNTQANSGNRGFNTISQYGRADFASIAEHELRLEMRDTEGEVAALLDKVGQRLGADLMVVTRGMRGSLIRDKDGTKTTVPAFTHKVVDRIGAGDAFLSVTAMAMRLECPPELLGFIGNVVGALAVGILGNQKSITPAAVKEYITKLF